MQLLLFQKLFNFLKELSGAEIREYLNITELEEVKFQDEMNVVVRSTQFSHDTNIESIFLLFRFLVLQVSSQHFRFSQKELSLFHKFSFFKTYIYIFQGLKY